MPSSLAGTAIEENYIIFHHTGQVYKLPVDPQSINDSMSASFAQNFPLSRSAPIYSYQNSGPRTIQFTFQLHRDLCRQCNPGQGDVVDKLINNLQGAVLPTYESASKMVNPPLVSLKLRDEVYIKGVVVGNVSLTYNLPIIKYPEGSKYALVDFTFSVSEVTPYDASILPSMGGFRNRVS